MLPNSGLFEVLCVGVKYSLQSAFGFHSLYSPLAFVLGIHQVNAKDEHKE